MLLEHLQGDTTEALPHPHGQVREQKQPRDPQHHPMPGPDLQQECRRQWPEDQPGLVGDLRVRQGPGVAVVLEDVRHQHFPGHDALGGQHPAQRREHHQPGDTAEENIQRHRQPTEECPVNLADVQNPNGRELVAQGPAHRKCEKARQRFDEKCQPGPGRTTGGLKHHQRHNEQQDLIGQPGQKQRNEKCQVILAHGDFLSISGWRRMQAGSIQG